MKRNERYNRIMESVSHGNDVFSTIQPGCAQTLSFETVSNEMNRKKTNEKKNNNF